MNGKLIVKILSKMLMVEAVLMLFPAGVSCIYGEWDTALWFVCTAAGLAVVCFPFLRFVRPEGGTLFAREGLIIVAAAWILWSLAGAVPFVLTGAAPHFVDAFFETVSGFTTTGATIFTDVEVLPQGLLFWRSFTHWIGGMGVLVFVMAIIPLAENSAMHLMRAEVPGPTVGKLVPRGKSTAKILYIIYIALTVMEILLLLCGGMPLFDSVVHAFGTAGTGGFSVKNASIGFYNSAYIDWVITVFMILFGVNFNIFFFAILRKYLNIWKNGEWKVYLGIIGASIAVITLSIQSMYDGFSTALRHAAFQVASIISTTGYATADFNTWPEIAKGILLLLMAVGACAGSTGGGIKVSRLVILVKSAGRELRRMVHPKSVYVTKVDERVVSEDTIHGVQAYLVVYLLVFCSSLLLVSFNNFDFETTFSAVMACLNNVGPGLGAVGPVSNFAGLSVFSKLVLTADMLFGRLEFFPLLLLFAPGVWRRKSF